MDSLFKSGQLVHILFCYLFLLFKSVKSMHNLTQNQQKGCIIYVLFACISNICKHWFYDQKGAEFLGNKQKLGQNTKSGSVRPVKQGFLFSLPKPESLEADRHVGQQL